jgi:hypothetical protein
VNALLSVLGDQVALDVLAATPARVRAIARGVGDDILERGLGAGVWSARDVLGHLLDVEVVYGFRMRLTLTEEEAHYPGYDEKRWASLPKPRFTGMLEAFAALRAVNLHLLRSLSGAAWSRVGHHSEQGPDPFDVQVRKLAGHDLAHLNQLQRAVDGG